MKFALNSTCCLFYEATYWRRIMHMFLLWTYANTIKKLLAADGVFLLSLEYQY